MKAVFPAVISAAYLLALVTAGPAVSRAQPAPAGSPAPGVLVDIGGHKLHLHCVGPTNAQTTVIFESGGGGYSKDWARVRERLPAQVRSCAYDRAGSGWSEGGPPPRTMRQEVHELHALLEAAKIRGPLVLVGHSIGGLLVRQYVEQYGSNVVGVVLLDPTHESSVLGSLRYGGWVRLREKAAGRKIPAPRLGGSPLEPVAPDTDFMAEEFQQMFLARQVNSVPFGDRPLIVLGAGIRQPPPGTSDDFWQKLKQEKETQVRDHVRLSRNGKFIQDPTSTHAIPQDNPQLVARAIEELLAALKSGAELQP